MEILYEGSLGLEQKLDSELGPTLTLYGLK